MTEHNFHPRYRPDIDGLRALAIFPVVAYHAFPRYAPGGFIGVDIFFVISGYLISLIIFKSLANNDFAFTEFYAHRIKRIFPALILVTSACYALGWFTLFPDEFKQLGKHIAAGMGFVQNFVLWQETGYFNVASELKPLMHLWSLAVEEQFYLIYPLLVWLAWKARLNILSGIVLLGIVSFVLSHKGVHHDAVKTFFAPHTRFWELMAGSGLAYVYGFRAWRPTFPRWINAGVFNRTILHEAPAVEDRGVQMESILSLIGLLLIVYSVVAYDRDIPYPGSRAVVPVLGTVLLILAGPQAWVNRKLLANKALVWIGLISYPLYLWHWPLLSFARIVQSETPSREIRIAAVAISFILAALTYYLIEKPIRYGRPTWRKITTLCLLAVLVGYVGYNSYSKNGLSFRFPKTVMYLIQYSYDYKQHYRYGTCFINFTHSDSNRNFDRCENETEHKKSIILWGDSHAAHLYPGFKKFYSNKFTIIQRNTAGCPPILTAKDSTCQRINNLIIDSIRNNRPDYVFLSAAWTGYEIYPSDIENTIETLRNIGIKNIFLVGPVPQWKGGLPKALYKYFKNHFPHIIPTKMKSELQSDLSSFDRILKRKYENSDVRYISPLDFLCDTEGCITRLGDSGELLTAWDYGHLTAAGSEYLVSHFPELSRAK